ncbi:MAG: tRNA (guanosine(37)-N1)-methyltransferase TrmD [Flavobacteriaceae bacterium]|nr:tRNA (guanosine(37)-N1)-methyltransferase TrmD [Flavobacteriaceae bacterium]
MHIQIITLFPEMFEGVFDHSMMYKAQEKKLAEIELVNLRDFGEGERKTVDDSPYGGGDGMLLKVEPLYKALEYAKSNINGKTYKVLLMTPRGNTYTQQTAQHLARSNSEDLIIICGRYEGYDERITEWVDMELSIGSYVLTGGEIPAMIITDSVVRLLPGVLGGETSAEIESFSSGDEVEYPQYTRPEEFKGQVVPEVLLSGNHGEIAKWRAEQAIDRSDERDK